MFRSVEEVQERLREQKYLADRPLAIAIYLAAGLGKPLLLEGEAGVGKTEVAKAVAGALGTKLIRLQCYEGIDASQALYEWNYPKQVLKIRIEERSGMRPEDLEATIYREEYLLKRPIYEAITCDRTPVLLIDEIDRADEEFEAFLLEVLSDFQITIPEIGTIRAKHVPFVVLTSNRTREIHDALKRRCLYQWIGFPTVEREYEIVTTKVPGISQALAAQICYFMQSLRELDLLKKPGIAETLDWAMALAYLQQDELTRQVVTDTISCILKNQEDIMHLSPERLTAILQKVYDASRGLVVGCDGFVS